MQLTETPLDYRAARSEIQNGDVLLFEGQSFYSRVIRAWTRSPIVHCGIAWRAFGRLLVVEALVGSGVDVTPVSATVARPGLVHWYRLDPTIDRGAVLSHALDQLGERYASWSQLARSFGLPASIRQRLGLVDDRDADRWFCSELVLSALYAGGYAPLDRRLSPATVAPAELIYLDCLERMGTLARPAAK